MSTHVSPLQNPTPAPIPFGRAPTQRKVNDYPHIEYVFFSENGDLEKIFTKPLGDYMIDARGDLPAEFIGPPARPIS